MLSKQQQNYIIGSSMALLATIIWAGNFIAAKIIALEISAYEVNFWRWFFASVILLPFSFSHFKKDWSIIKSEFKLLLYFGFMGVFINNLFFSMCICVYTCHF